jgi:hypothetical protein
MVVGERMTCATLREVNQQGKSETYNLLRDWGSQGMGKRVYLFLM